MKKSKFVYFKNFYKIYLIYILFIIYFLSIVFLDYIFALIKKFIFGDKLIYNVL